MNRIKQTLVVMLVAAALLLVTGCSQRQAEQQWEYKVVQFDRDESNTMGASLGALGADGWEYAGPLANNGINAQYVAFKRPK